MKRFVLHSVVFAVLMCGVPRATAGESVQSRTGFFVGFGYGGGVAAWDRVPEGIGDASEGSGTFHLRFGVALRDDFLVGFEGSVWAKRWDVGDVEGNDLGELTLRLVASTVAVTFFPGNVGLALRAGFGIGAAFADVLDGVDGFSPSTETGFAMLGGMGYDWRITDRIAIGPEIQISYLAIDENWFAKPMFVDGSVHLNWYW